MAPIPQDAVFATLLMTDSYLPGAMVLGHSLRDRGAKAKLIALVVLEKLAAETIAELRTIYDDIVPVQQIINVTPANLYLMDRPDLISTFTKIELWRQTQYRRIVYLDADMVAIRSPNELLVLDTNFAAVPDVGWPDCFNSGLMVLNPNLGDYYSLLALARRGISFDGADQGLLNMHFVDWERLSFVYNCTPSANYQYAPAYRHFGSSISMIHFIGAEKPWNLGRENRHDNGIFGELLGRWWTVYDRHYRRPKTMYQPGQFVQNPKRVQDYVHGEETVYEQIYQAQPATQVYDAQQAQSSFNSNQQHQHYQHYQPSQSSSVHENRGQNTHWTHDQSTYGRDVPQEGQQATPNTQHTTWTPPQTEWEPTRQPPPQNSKPEAANFPTQQYEMSHSTQLFEPPAAYPEPPKDMWYQVPEKPKPQPSRTIFPWEARAPKATRVFPRSREPSPPPSAAGTAPSLGSPLQFTHATAGAPRKESITSPPAPPPKPPSPPRHVFPWESRAPKATRVFPQEQPPPPPPILDPGSERDHEEAPSMTTDATDRNTESVTSPKAPEQTWDTLQQRPNVWDEMPEISKYMESINKPRRGKIQVLHHTPSQSLSSVGAVISPLANEDRRASLIITDFPTKDERPSLPVTPAPIRRPSFWGDEKEDQGLLPGVDGVPKQDQWVRRFTSYPSPAFPAALQSIIDGILHIKCQHCGKQNPIARLEELSRRQNELLTEGASAALDASKTPPKREMPESKTREEVEEATVKSILGPFSKTEGATTPRKPILREPHFERTDLDDEELKDEEKAPTPNRSSPPQVRTPTRFSPFVLEGEAASTGADEQDIPYSTSAMDESASKPTTFAVV